MFSNGLDSFCSSEVIFSSLFPSHNFYLLSSCLEVSAKSNAHRDTLWFVRVITPCQVSELAASHSLLSWTVPIKADSFRMNEKRLLHSLPSLAFLSSSLWQLYMFCFFLTTIFLGRDYSGAVQFNTIKVVNKRHWDMHIYIDTCIYLLWKWKWVLAG